MPVRHDPAGIGEDGFLGRTLVKILTGGYPDGDRLHGNEDSPPVKCGSVANQAAGIFPDGNGLVMGQQPSRKIGHVPIPERVQRPRQVFEGVTQVTHFPVENPLNPLVGRE